MVENIEIKAPLILIKDKPSVVQFVAGKDDFFEIHGKQDKSEGEWTLHARGRFGYFKEEISPKVSLVEIKERCSIQVLSIIKLFFFYFCHTSSRVKHQNNLQYVFNNKN